MDPYAVSEDNESRRKDMVREADKEIIEKLKERRDALEQGVSGFGEQWRDLQKFVRPGSPLFGQRNGAAQTKDIFDSTAPAALEQWAAGLHSYLTSPTDRWFNLVFATEPDSKATKSEKMWFEKTADTIYFYYSLPQANFDPSMHEVYLDLGAYGTSVLFQQAHPSGKGVILKTFPLSDCRIAEDAWGRVDTVFRKCRYTVRQIQELFPVAKSAEFFLNKKPEDMVDIWHAVFPNPVRDPQALDHRRFPIASAYWCEEAEIVLSISGYRTMPYHACRWAKNAGEVYGRSPGMAALADIKMVNAMSKEMILSAELANRPPLVIDDESLLMPIKQLIPGSLLYKQPGTEMPQPIQLAQQPQLAKEELLSRRDAIRSAFFVDMLFRGKKKERQSVLEIQDDRAELIRQLTPMFGRIQVELLTPMIARTYDILEDQGLVEATGFDTEGREIDVAYTNSAARSQVAGRAMSITAFLADITGMAQVDPSIFDVIDMPEAAQQLALARDVPQSVLRSKEQVAAMQAARAKAQQQQMATQQAADMSGAVKNIAQARAVDPSLSGGL